MKPFDLQEVRDNKPFEVFFRQVGWVEGKLLHVSKHDCGTYEIKVGFTSVKTIDSEWLLLPSGRLRMKEEVC